MGFDGMDSDKDGKITLDEWKKKKSGFDDITEAGFKAADLDQDGFLSFSEMYGQSKEQLKETDPKEANGRIPFFDGMDSDKDGKITLDEWKKKKSGFDDITEAGFKAA